LQPGIRLLGIVLNFLADKTAAPSSSVFCNVVNPTDVVNISSLEMKKKKIVDIYYEQKKNQLSARRALTSDSDDSSISMQGGDAWEAEAHTK
jgi:hypothetical protein